MKCPTCGHVTRPRTQSTGADAPVDLATLSDAALYAHYKRTAPFEDLAFWLRTITVPAIRAALVDLRVAAFTPDGDLLIPRAEFYRRFTRLQAAWRGAITAREQAERLDKAAA